MRSKQDEARPCRKKSGGLDRREFMQMSAAALGAAAFAPSSLFAAVDIGKKPNILFILSDNQPASMLGCYGNPDIKTPHIDRLASEGVRFTRAFACNGLCSPTRASLMTGLIPSQHGIHDWIDDRAVSQWPEDWCAVQEFRTLPLTLVNRGYRTAMIGKYHLGQPKFPMPGFQDWITFPYGHTLDFWHNTIIDNGKEYRNDDKHIVEFFAEKGADYIRKQDGKKPFYLQLNFDGPYLLPPTNLGPDPNPFYKEYVGKEFKAWPRTRFNENLLREIDGPDDPKNMERHMMYDLIRMHQDPESMANTASQNAVVDAGVGKVMEALKEMGLDENTLVVFSTDQADFYGQFGLYGHTNFTLPSSLYDCVLNVPLIMRQPGTIISDNVRDQMVGQYDIMPTILDWAGFGSVKIADSPGRSFARLLRGEVLEGWGDEVYFEQEESRGVRTPKFAYWKRLQGFGPAQLFDVETDPGQNRNLFGQPGYDDVVRELDQKLTAFFERYADPKYDLWKGGKTKSFTGRTAIVNKLTNIGWAQDPTTRPLFQDVK
jgi:arylsulfatase A-like enzyme